MAQEPTPEIPIQEYRLINYEVLNKDGQWITFMPSERAQANELYKLTSEGGYVSKHRSVIELIEDEEDDDDAED